jgi:hypothetical protein
MSMMQDWRDGLLSDQQALCARCSDLGEVESEIKPLSDERTAIRADISAIVAYMGGKATVPGFGWLVMRAPSMSRPYDEGALDEVVQSLRETGYSEIANEIANCRKTQTRAGGLAITPEKPKQAKR